jgi:hypothetical protein
MGWVLHDWGLATKHQPIAKVLDALPPWPFLLLSFAVGVLGPVLASWFVVAPLKGSPSVAGWVLQGLLAGILINGFWGDRLGADLRRVAPLGLRSTSTTGGLGRP